MIRAYKKGDELKLKPNKFSDVSSVDDIFDNDNYIKHTLDDNGEIKCIMCWYNHAPDRYAIFFLMPDGVEFKHARALKRFLDEMTERLKPKSCVTYSFDCDMLNRWHEFFGFQKRDGDGVLIDNKKFNKWEILWA